MDVFIMDVFIPRARIHQPMPAVLWLHGGAWEGGDKNGSSGARFLAAAGFVTASIYYHLSGEAKFPADIEDCKCAIRYLRANAPRYSIAPESIPITGASSGGHLAMLAATAAERAGFEGSGEWPNVSSRVKAVVSYYGPTDFRPLAADFGVRAQAAITKLIGVAFADHRDRYARASPITFISAGHPPLLIFHGDGDTLVPFSQSERMRDAYRKAGLSVELVDNNRPLSISIEQIYRTTIDFFRQRLQ